MNLEESDGTQRFGLFWATNDLFMVGLGIPRKPVRYQPIEIYLRGMLFQALSNSSLRWKSHLKLG